jgi:acetyl esterase/lipase
LRLLLLAFAAVVALLALAYHLAALQIFNLIVPKDGGTLVVARRVAFGPDAAQKLDIYAPEGERAGLPVVVFIHGGSWENGDKDGYDFVGRAFAAQGFLTLVADYRKRPQHPYPAFVEDAALALAFAQNNSQAYGGDGGRIFAVGHSAGHVPIETVTQVAGRN